MAQYCDTKKLEKVWFNWLLSKSAPTLEPYRKAGVLWTKAIGLVDVKGEVIVKGGKTFKSPTHPIRSHCILSRYPFFFTTFNGKPQELASQIHYNEHGDYTTTPIALSEIEIVKTKPEIKDIEQILLKDGYILDAETGKSWESMLIDINKMCLGIASKFHQKTAEELNDLANEALLQVANKLYTDRLVYTPGRAPVFNLLTTTIHRCMFSIMNKRKNQREGLNRLLQDAQSGSLPQTNRSLRLQTFTTRKHENR